MDINRVVLSVISNCGSRLFSISFVSYGSYTLGYMQSIPCTRELFLQKKERLRRKKKKEKKGLK